MLAVVLFSAGFVRAQTAAEVTVSFSEQFFNQFLDAIFTNLETPKFELAKNVNHNRRQKKVDFKPIKDDGCDESVTLLRETNGVKTAVRFENGKILAPLAFNGIYEVPFVGCSNFRGVAETDLTLEFDRAAGLLVGRVNVGKVNLNGVPGIASGVVGKIVQNSIDKRVNPLEILKANQLAATVPVAYANGALKLRVADMKPEVVGNALNVRVTFEFTKAQ